MTETAETKTKEPEVVVEKAPDMTTMERIKILGELANAIQNQKLLDVISELPSGDRLLRIFTESISKEIDGMINPGNKLAPKELLDTLAAANGLKNLIGHSYAMMAEISRAPVLGVLGILNQNLGGNAMKPYQPQEQGEEPQQQPQPQQPRPRQPQGGGSTPGRGGDTGLSW